MMMEFNEAVKTCLLEKYAVFRGRASRAEFWWFQLFLHILGSVVAVVVFLISFIINMIILNKIDNYDSWPSRVSGVSIYLVIINMIVLSLPWIVAIAMFIPSLSVVIRRLHDIGRTGWWVLLGVVPILSFILTVVVVVNSTNRHEALVLFPIPFVVAAVVWAVFLFWWIRRSDPNDNIYGPSPYPPRQEG